ncbi:FkbM family methyltransferase [Streptomyces cavourensis]|uniref:FkbM family methyltransferase n=2 Tax=Streptomyces cavourensis TaxID=67258 RepID=UPI003B8A9A04
MLQRVERGAPGHGIDPRELETVTAELLAPGCPPTGMIRLGAYALEYVAPRAFAHTLRLLFGSRVYDVAPLSPPYRIIDGGGWLGLSVLRFRELFPDARIVVFEPEPEIFRIMCRNLERNGIGNVEPVRAALAGTDGPQTFTVTGSDSGSLRADARGSDLTVDTCRLGPHVTEPLSLLKLNVEGAEAEVIAELGEKLTLVDQVLRACRESTRRFDLVLVEVEESLDVSRCAEAGGRGGDVNSVGIQERANVFRCAADGHGGGVEELAQEVHGREFPQVEHGGQDSVG